MHEQIRNIPFELKELSDTGDFVGIASVYGNIDLGNDVVDPGAFDQSIKDHGAKVRLMDSHKVRIGVATVESTPIGLKAVGKINTNKQSGAEALSDLKFYKDNGMPMGMSIGYETIKADPPHLTKDGARHLKQCRLWEVTITEFPMNEKALVTSVKSIRDLIAAVKASRTAAEQKDDFTAELQQIQLYAARWQMQSALSSALSSILYDREVEDKITASKESIQQFMDAYLEMLPEYLALLEEDGMGWMSQADVFEKKAGRVLSQSNRDLIARCVKDLQALLDSTDDSDSEEKSRPAPTGAATSEQDDHHSESQVLIDQIKAELSA